MKIRKTLKYPPYYYLCNIRISGKDASYILDEALNITKEVEVENLYEEIKNIEGNVDAVMDGDIDGFINAYLKWRAN